MATYPPRVNGLLPCGICPKGFKTPQTFNQHRKTHSKPFECKTCKSRFALRADVSRHTRTQHQIAITRYFCEEPDCEYKATRKDNLQQHRRRKHHLPVSPQLHQLRASTPLDYVDSYQRVGGYNAFLEAASSGQIELLEAAFGSGVGVSTTGDDGSTALHCAARTGQLSVVEYLLGQNANIEAQNDSGRTPLHETLKGGHKKTAERLLSVGADARVLDNKKRSALHYAAKLGNLDLFETVSNHIEPDHVQRETLKEILLIAVNAAKTSIVESILSKWQLQVKSESDMMDSSLRLAVEKNCIEIAELLLKAGANINTNGKSFYGNYSNALQATIFRGNEQMMKLLLENGADVNAKGGSYDNPLYTAIVTGQEQAVKLLLYKGADINAKGAKYGNVLYAAMRTSKNQYQMVKLLIDKGANVKASRGRCNALYKAVSNGSVRIVKLLLDKGADVNANRGHHNALYTAIYEGREDIVKLLLDSGADVNANSGQRNALYEATIRGQEQIIDMLLDKGAAIF